MDDTFNLSKSTTSVMRAAMGNTATTIRQVAKAQLRSTSHMFQDHLDMINSNLSSAANQALLDINASVVNPAFHHQIDAFSNTAFLAAQQAAENFKINMMTAIPQISKQFENNAALAFKAAANSLPNAFEEVRQTIEIELQDRLRLLELNISASIEAAGHFQNLSELIDAGYGDLAFSELEQQGLIVVQELVEGDVGINHTELPVIQKYELFGLTPKDVIKYITDRTLVPILLILFAEYILLPTINDIRSKSNLPSRQQNKQIAQVPVSMGLPISSSSRFISADQVRLRRGPSTKNIILAELGRGTILTFVQKSKTRKWTQVIATVNGKTMEGWVFSRYVSRFKGID